MADIKITELHPAGSELLQIEDSESFLDELKDEEMSISGGTNGAISISVDNRGGVVSVNGDLSTSGGDISTSGGDISIG